MFLSVIIPNYNHSKFLEQRINSVLNQDFDDYEIIILDDNSTDNSYEIINKFRSNKYVSHIVFNKTNSGSPFLQWQKGFELSSGEYVWIAESDDYADEKFLSTIIPLLKEHRGAPIAYCYSQFVDINGNDLKMGHNIISKNPRFYTSTNFIKKKLLLGNTICNASAAIFKKDVLKCIDDSYCKFKAAGDWLFWIEIAEKGTVIEVRQQLNFFRQHQMKVSPKSKATGISFKEMRLIYLWLKQKGYINNILKHLVIGHRLYVIHRFKDFANQEIRQESYNLYNQDTLCPFCDRYLYLIYRSFKFIVYLILKSFYSIKQYT